MIMTSSERAREQAEGLINDTNAAVERIEAGMGVKVKPLAAHLTRLDEALGEIEQATFRRRDAGERELHNIAHAARQSVPDGDLDLSASPAPVGEAAACSTCRGAGYIWEDDPGFEGMGHMYRHQVACPACAHRKAVSASPSTAVVSEPVREGWVLVPREPTEAMLAALSDPEAPFISRRPVDVSHGYGEVVEQTNDDWQDTIGTDKDFRHHGYFPSTSEARKEAERLSLIWHYRAMIAALTRQGEETREGGR